MRGCLGLPSNPNQSVIPSNRVPKSKGWMLHHCPASGRYHSWRFQEKWDVASPDIQRKTHKISSKRSDPYPLLCSQEKTSPGDISKQNSKTRFFFLLLLRKTIISDTQRLSASSPLQLFCNYHCPLLPKPFSTWVPLTCNRLQTWSYLKHF